MSGPTNPTEAHFDKGLWGWDLTQWRKLSLLWGISANLGATVYDLDADPGTNTLSSLTVPAGQVWVVESAAMVDRNTVTTYNLLTAYKSGQPIVMLEGVQPAIDRYVYWNGRITLWEDDYLSANFYGCNAGDDIVMRYGGYRMYIAE